MTLITRPLNNIGSPLCLPDGTPVSDAAVTFTLVSPRGQPVDGQDALSGERVVWKATTTTNAAGEFTVKAWPNSRGTYPTKYLCHVAHPGARDCYGVVTDGTEALSWAQFMAGGESTGGGITPPSNPGSGATNLSAVVTASGITVRSDTGSSALLPAATESNAGLMLPAQVIKLNTLGGGGPATDYQHPATHPATMIDQDEQRQFVSAAQKTAWDGKQAALGFTPVNTVSVGAPDGIAPLDGTGKIAAVYLPSFVDDVLEAASFAALPAVGEAGKIYTTLDDNKIFRWGGSSYVAIAASPGTTDEVTEGPGSLYFTAARVRATVLTGLSLTASTVVNATHSVLQAIGFLQKQVSDNAEAIAGKQAAGKYATGTGTASGTNTGDETPATLGATLAGAATKAAPSDADMLALSDSAAGGLLKKLSWANVKTTIQAALIATANTWTKAQVGGVSALAVTGNTIAIADLSAANNYAVTLQATTAQTLANPTAGILPGQSGQIVITQNAAPSILTFGSYWKPHDGATPAVSTAAGAQNLLSYYVASPTAIWYSLAKQGVA